MTKREKEIKNCCHRGRGKERKGGQGKRQKVEEGRRR